MRDVRVFLYPDLMRRVRAGRQGLLCPMVDLLRESGFDVSLQEDSPENLHAGRDGYSVVRMIAPLGPQGVTFRRTYLEPFYHIETTANRWDWPVARAAFDPDQPAHKAARFMKTQAGRLFGDRPVTREGFVFVPLQGRLLEQRSFQSMTPVAMIEALLDHDPKRRIVATLHPRETYAPAEITALERLERIAPRFEMARAPSADLLTTCDYVATMNSSVALQGYFIGKPAVLFGQVDFHHIAAKVPETGMEAIRAAPDLTPDYAAYLWWFFRVMAIRAAGDDAKRGIRSALMRAGWPL